MDFSLSQEQIAFKNLAKQFAQEALLPHAAHWDEHHIFPIEPLKKAAALGFAALYTPSDIGGAGLSRLDAALIFEELATACPSTTAYLTIHNMVCWLINTYGNDEIRHQFVPKLASMELFGSYCLTEPGAGSDAASLTTTATQQGNEFILNGSKAFISGGSTSDIYVCMVRTGGEGPKGISCILVEKDSPGLSFGKKEKKLGWHSQPTTMVFFENCRVPVKNLIGEMGKGFNIALSALNGGRVNIAACSLGGAKQCFTYARKHMFERMQFGKKLADMQALQFKMADMITEFEAARLLNYRAASALDHQEQNAHHFCAMAKRFATDICFEITHQSLQLLGGYGYLQEYPIERYFRDLRVHQILEGTNEIMRLIIAREIFSEPFEMA